MHMFSIWNWQDAWLWMRLIDSIFGSLQPIQGALLRKAIPIFLYKLTLTLCFFQEMLSTRWKTSSKNTGSKNFAQSEHFLTKCENKEPNQSNFKKSNWTLPNTSIFKIPSIYYTCLLHFYRYAQKQRKNYVNKTFKW